MLAATDLYSKKMLDMMLNIRKALPAEERSAIKLSTPNILDAFVRYYHTTGDGIVRALIVELMIEAGEEWYKKILLQEKKDINPLLFTFEKPLVGVKKIISQYKVVRC